MAVLAAHADGPLHSGMTVILREGDESVVQARVVKIVNGLASLDVNWKSWNHVNTLMDALEASLEAVRQTTATLDHLFERRPTGYDPDDLPEQKVEIPA